MTVSVPAVQGLISIWLLASEGDEAVFEAAIRELAERLGGPRFHPHLTLAGDLDTYVEEAIHALPALAARHLRFELDFQYIGVGTDYFRSFYAAFVRSASLEALRVDCWRAAGKEPPPDFLPHVSLAYGATEGEARTDAQVDYSKRLFRRAVAFDRIAVVASSARQPIGSWRILAEAELAGA